MKEIKRDLIVYCVLILAAVIVYFFIIPNQIYVSSSAAAEAFSPDTFPRFAAIIFLIAAVIGLLNSIRLYLAARNLENTLKETKHIPSTAKERIASLIPYLVFLLILLYGILFYKLGFILATVTVPPVILLSIGCRKWHYYGIYYAFALILYLLFRYILLVPIR